jgi:hypothetical protein
MLQRVGVFSHYVVVIEDSTILVSPGFEPHNALIRGSGLFVGYELFVCHICIRIRGQIRLSNAPGFDSDGNRTCSPRNLTELKDGVDS